MDRKNIVVPQTVTGGPNYRCHHMVRKGKAKHAEQAEDEQEVQGRHAPSEWSARGGSKKKSQPHQPNARPGKLGFGGVEDDGAAQSKYKGLSSGARAALRKKLDERSSGEADPVFELPAVPTKYVDCLFFASEVYAKKDTVMEAAQSLSSLASSSSPSRMTVLDAFSQLGGPQCDATIPAYITVCEMDAAAGDVRYRAWEQHQPRHAAFGLEAMGVAMIGAALADSGTNDLTDGPLPTLLEMWDSPVCVAAGPLALAYSGADEASRLHQLRGMARLLREALVRQRPVMLTCDGDEAEQDLARLALAALDKAPPPTSALLAPRPCMRGLPVWRPCTPLIVYEAAGLWERLAAGWPWCAYMLFDGALTFAKAPRALLNVAFDVPSERVLLASAAPRHTPAAAAAAHAADGKRGLRPCHPAHVVQTAERLAALRSTTADTVDAAAILCAARENTRLLFPALGLMPAEMPTAAAPPAALAPTPEAQAEAGAEAPISVS